MFSIGESCFVKNASDFSDRQKCLLLEFHGLFVAGKQYCYECLSSDPTKGIPIWSVSIWLFIHYSIVIRINNRHVSLLPRVKL